MRKKNPNHINIDELRALLRKKLNIKVGRTGLYYWIHIKNLPVPSGLSGARYWDKQAVMDWIATQEPIA